MDTLLGSIFVFDVRTGVEVVRIDSPVKSLHDFALSHDGGAVAVVTTSGEKQVLERHGAKSPVLRICPNLCAVMGASTGEQAAVAITVQQ
jgi:hypothetical protein